MTALPPAATDDAFTTVCQDDTVPRPGVERLCRRLKIDGLGLTRFAVGSRPVYAAGDLVLKLFPPVDLDGYRAEADDGSPLSNLRESGRDGQFPSRPPR